MTEQSNLASSYTAASTFPIKVLQNKKLMQSINENGKILPIHLQLNPSNICNFHCGFCSCDNRDRTSLLPFDKLTAFLAEFKKIGGQCTTITGGGDPLTYPHIHELLLCLNQLGIDVGLVCNGSLIDRLNEDDFKCITWIRISSSDELPEQANLIEWFKKLSDAIDKSPTVNWAFSYVVSETPSIELISMIVKFANIHNFTHVRLVSDLLDVAHAGNMATIKRQLIKKGIDDSHVIYQGRKDFTHGTKKCYISLAKPVVSAEGKILPCCGTQYSLETPSLDYEKSMVMGDMDDLPKLIEEQKCFDGSKCVRCYYSEYNDLFEALKQPLQHKEFI